jgi:hypothetical protein
MVSRCEKSRRVGCNATDTRQLIELTDDLALVRRAVTLNLLLQVGSAGRGRDCECNHGKHRAEWNSHGQLQRPIDVHCD